MSYNQDGDHVYKPIVQNELWKRVRDTVRTMLCFPARDCRDLKEGIERGKITKDTTLLLFEMDPEIMEHIRTFCQANGLDNAILFQMRFEDILKRKHLRPDIVTDTYGRNFCWTGTILDMLRQIVETDSATSHVQVAKELDLFFPDFCGDITSPIMLAIYKFLRLFDTSEMVSGYTFATTMRNNKLYRRDKDIGDYGFACEARIPGSASFFPPWSPLNDKAIWIADYVMVETLKDAKSGIGGNWKWDKFLMYKEDGPATPMVFLLHDMKRQIAQGVQMKGYQTTSTIPVNATGPKLTKLQEAVDDAPTAGKQAWATRQLNIMLKAIEKLEKSKKGKTAGVKAGITKRIKALVA